MIEAWKKFFGTGWPYGKEPSKQDCFKAGYEAGAREVVKQENEYFSTFAGYTPSEILNIINQWKEKFGE